jgi:hypothetical protein
MAARAAGGRGGQRRGAGLVTAGEMIERPGARVGWPEPGQFFRDLDGAVVLVLASPRWPGVLRCGGVAMVQGRPLPCSYHTGTGIGAVLRPGRRYRDPASGLEVRCLRAGSGHLSYRALQ